MRPRVWGSGTGIRGGVLWAVFHCLGLGMAVGGSWNQWLGGAGRQLGGESAGSVSTGQPSLVELWRRPLGSGYAGISVQGPHAVTGMTDGKSDLFVGLDSATGDERWRLPLGRTRRRGKEGAPPGPLSTPALDDENGYCQSLDGRFVCVDLRSGALRWEVEVAKLFGAYQPGYGFASSPLLLKDQVVLMPAGSRSASVVALDRTTGAVRWKARLDDATEYVSPTFLERGKDSQIVAQVGSVIAGLSQEDGSRRWQVEGVDGGLWTPSVLRGGRVFVPTAGVVRVLEISTSAAREIWRSEVFEGVMGPVVEVGAWLVGHHKRRLTAVDVETGNQAWQREEESDGQLIVVGGRLVFLHDRLGILQILEVDRKGVRVVAERKVISPARIEAPLAYADGRLYVRTLSELVALRLGVSE